MRKIFTAALLLLPLSAIAKDGQIYQCGAYSLVFSAGNVYLNGHEFQLDRRSSDYFEKIDTKITNALFTSRDGSMFMFRWSDHSDRIPYELTTYVSNDDIDGVQTECRFVRETD